MHEEIYERLKQVAAAGGTVTYGNLAPLAGLYMDVAADRGRLGEILDEISKREHGQGREMFSAVVVQSRSGHPGEGFFDLAFQLGLFDAKDDLAFFAAELRRVHDYWRSV